MSWLDDPCVWRLTLMIRRIKGTAFRESIPNNRADDNIVIYFTIQDRRPASAADWLAKPIVFVPVGVIVLP